MVLKCLAISILFATGSGAYASTVDQNGIVRDADGHVLTMSQKQAIKACAENGMHLPTIRELAKLSQSMGAKGILETRVKDGSGEKPEGFHLVSSINPDGKKDEFYFSRSGYVAPKGDLGNNFFWSSSVDSRVPKYGNGLNGANGADVINFGADPNFNFAVRCFAGKLL